MTAFLHFIKAKQLPVCIMKCCS